MRYRKPNPSDIGKLVEFKITNDFDEWRTAPLERITHTTAGAKYQGYGLWDVDEARICCDEANEPVSAETQRLHELASMVKTMRQLQTEFFRTSKTASAYERATLVERAKKLEAEVDKAVEKVLNPKPEQAQLF